MKGVFLLFVLGLAFAASADTHLFDNLLQELMKVLHEVHKHNHDISLNTCHTDCETQLSLASAMCTRLCRLAAEKYKFVHN